MTGIDIHENSNEYHSYIIMNHYYIPSAVAKPVSWCYLHRSIVITTINPTVDPRELWLKKPGKINIRPNLWNKNGESWILWECMEMYGNVWKCMEMYGNVWECITFFVRKAQCGPLLTNSSRYIFTINPTVIVIMYKLQKTAFSGMPYTHFQTCFLQNIPSLVGKFPPKNGGIPQ